MQDALMFRDHPDYDRQTDEQSADAPGSVSILQVVTGIVAAGCLILMVADMAATESFIPVQIRILLVIAAIGTLAVYLTMWSDVRNERRHQMQMVAIVEQAKRGEYIRGYVDGLERNGFQP